MQISVCTTKLSKPKILSKFTKLELHSYSRSFNIKMPLQQTPKHVT